MDTIHGTTVVTRDDWTKLHFFEPSNHALRISDVFVHFHFNIIFGAVHLAPSENFRAGPVPRCCYTAKNKSCSDSWVWVLQNGMCRAWRSIVMHSNRINNERETVEEGGVDCCCAQVRSAGTVGCSDCLVQHVVTSYMSRAF